MNKCRLKRAYCLWRRRNQPRLFVDLCAFDDHIHPFQNHVHFNKGLCSHYACRTEILLGSRSRLTFSGGPMTTIRDTCLRMFRSIMTVSYKFSDLFTYQKPSALSTPVLLMNKYRLYNIYQIQFRQQKR